MKSKAVRGPFISDLTETSHPMDLP
jgi:hypothetical protein